MSVRLIASALAVLGAASVTVGAAMIYRPAGLIVGGLIMLAAGVEALRPKGGGT